jgi:hypothetical protein
MIGWFFGLRQTEATGFGNITPHKVPDVQYGGDQELTGANASIRGITSKGIYVFFRWSIFVFKLYWLSIAFRW